MKQEPYDEARERRKFKRSTKLQAEFGDEATYLAYCRGAASGRITPPHHSVVVTEPDRVMPPHHSVVVAEPDRVITRPATRVTSRDKPGKSRFLDHRPATRVTSRQEVAAEVEAGLRETWDRHGPQPGRIYCFSPLSRFGNFEEFAHHVANHGFKAAQ